MSSETLSVVIPVYQGEPFVEEMIERLEKTLKRISGSFEIILVDDYSKDLSWILIEKLATRKPFVKGIKLSRNFGQHYAISAGLDHCKGDWIVVMDCDLQDQPEEIIKLKQKADEGYSAVLASRHVRKDLYLKRLFSKIFYKFLSYLTGHQHDEAIANFGIYSKALITEVCRMRESIRYFPTMVKWVGFTTCSIEVEHAARTTGRSAYNFKKLLNLAIDIILAYSDKPLRLVIKTGVLISFFSFIFACYIAIQWFNNKIEVLGYASIIVSIWFLSGCILFTLGVVGLYVGKIFEGVKSRPLYIIEKIT